MQLSLNQPAEMMGRAMVASCHTTRSSVQAMLDLPAETWKVAVGILMLLSPLLPRSRQAKQPLYLLVMLDLGLLLVSSAHLWTFAIN